MQSPSCNYKVGNEHLLGFQRYCLMKRCRSRSFALVGHDPPLSSWMDTCTCKEKTNTSVKSDKSNYTSVRKDVIHINHYRTNENGTIIVVIYLY